MIWQYSHFTDFVLPNQHDPVAAIGLHIEAASAQDDRAQRLKFSADLSRYFMQLKGKCPVCWTLKGLILEKHNPLFQACRQALNVPFVQHGMGWIEFKRASQSQDTSVKYCYGCGVPVGDFMPDAHRSVPLGPKCTWCDFPQVAIWLIFHTDDLWQKARLTFDFDQITTLEAFREWCKATESRSQFCNAVQLFIWLCKYRGLA